MGKFLWIVGLASLGVAAYVILNEQSGSYAGADGEELSGKAGLWGTKQRVKGTGGVLGGKIEKGLGDLADDPAVKGKGLVDQAVGTVKDTAGKAAHAVSDALSDAKS